MLSLHGKISVKKMQGRLNLIPTKGNVMLQVKVVKPTYERQNITADTEDGYVGLSTVIVEPKERALIEITATAKNVNCAVSGVLVESVSEEYIPEE